VHCGGDVAPRHLPHAHLGAAGAGDARGGGAGRPLRRAADAAAAGAQRQVHGRAPRQGPTRRDAASTDVALVAEAGAAGGWREGRAGVGMIPTRHGGGGRRERRAAELLLSSQFWSIPSM